MNKAVTRTSLFWVLFTTLSAVAGYCAYYYFPKAFPLLTIDLKMDRELALQKAAELATKYGWGPERYKQAVSFGSEREAKNYIELEGGGLEKLREIIKEGYFSPYQWIVRHFKHQDAHETDIYFTPEGRPYSFVETLDEKAPGAALATAQAREIALHHAHADWFVNFDDYNLVEESQVTRPSGRIDHTFVYEKKKVKIGEGLYRLKLVVSGDKFTELSLNFKVPEGFTRRYEHMRSTNKAIATGARVILVLFYVVGGIILGLWLLLKKQYVLWKRPVFWALFLGLLQVGNAINDWPLRWMSYDTAVSPISFFIQFLIELLTTFLMFSSAFTLLFAAAESLTRKAFGNQPQLWRLWSAQAAPTIQTLGRTIGGYLFSAFDLLYVVLFYLVTIRLFNWWSPAEALLDPNSLATYVPWFSAITQALTAGFWEECMFRAVPLSCAALLGKKFGKRNLFIGVMLVIQAIVFGAAHANYAAQPSYARVVELAFPSFIWGLIFIRFGLLPMILLHFTYDAILMALPIFISTAPGMWLNQVMVIVAVLIPLFILIYYRFLSGRWHELPQHLYNAAWQPPHKEYQPIRERPTLRMADLAQRIKQIILLSGIAGFCLWGLFTHFEQDSKPLTISRTEALTKATEYMHNHGIDLGPSWSQQAYIETNPTMQHTFIWRTGGKQLYHQLIGTYLMPAAWIVRYAQFTGDLEERAEEYQLYLTQDGTVARFNHLLPEKRPGAKLSEDDARKIAHEIIRTEYQLDPTTLQEISAESKQHPARKDWNFIVNNTAISLPEHGQARITIAIDGDTVTDHYRSVFVPETWERSYRHTQTILQIISIVCILLLGLLLLWGLLRGFSHHYGMAWWTAIIFAIVLLIKSLIQLFNLWPTISAHFSTSQPYGTQAYMTIANVGIQILVTTGLTAWLAGFTKQWHFALHTKYSAVQRLLFGGSLAVALVGIQALIKKIVPALNPIWADYAGLAAWSPIINIIFLTFTTFVQTTLAVLLIFCIIDGLTHGWHSYKKPWTLGFIGLGIILAGINITKTENIIAWLLGGSIQGVLIGIFYVFILRFDRAILPLICAGLSILATVQNGILMANPTAIPGVALASLVIGLFSWWWSQLLSED